jgi:hypothetical protein
VAAVAHAQAVLFRAGPEARARAGALPDWLDACIDGALLALLAEQAEEERSRRPLHLSPDLGFYRDLGRRFGIGADGARRLCCYLNGLPRERRRAHRALLELARAGGRARTRCGGIRLAAVPSAQGRRAVVSQGT